MERYSVNRVKGQDVNISMPVGSSFTQVGLTESIDRLVDDETNKSINPYQDEEQIAYKTIDTNGFDMTSLGGSHPCVRTLPRGRIL